MTKRALIAATLVACSASRLTGTPVPTPTPPASTAPTCGNHKVDDGETCDTGIVSGKTGACPQSCTANGVCDVAVMSGDACTLLCTHTATTTAVNGDGCCPDGLVQAQDNDCPAVLVCGNGAVDGGETCDTGIVSGKGACPSICPSGGVCATAALSGSGCTVSCAVTVKPVTNGDGCCQSPADTDTDCPPLNATPVCPAQTFNATQKWKWESPPLDVLTTAQTEVTPIVAQFTDDNHDGVIDDRDVPDVFALISKIATTGNGLTVEGVLFSGDTGAVHWAKDFGAIGAAPFVHPAAGDLDGDGKIELVLATAKGDPTAITGLVALDNTGAVKWYSDPLPNPVTPDGYGALTIADIDGDSKAEIIFGNRVFNSDGHLRWAGPANPSPPQVGHLAIAVELGGDPGLEIIDGGTAYNANGKQLWSYTGVGYGHVAVGDCDGDGSPEIMVAGQNSTSLAPEVVLLDVHGHVVAGPALTPVTAPISPIAVGDLDGDGLPEFVASTHTQLIAMDCHLNIVMHSDTTIDVSGASGPVLFDFDGDGKMEIVYGDEWKIRVFNGAGHQLWSDDRQHNTGLETPVVADIDGDGHADIVVPQGRHAGAVPMPAGVIAYKAGAGNTWTGARKIWNQHAYQPLGIFENGKLAPYSGAWWQRANVFRANIATGACP